MNKKYIYDQFCKIKRENSKLSLEEIIKVFYTRNRKIIKKKNEKEIEIVKRGIETAIDNGLPIPLFKK